LLPSQRGLEKKKRVQSEAPSGKRRGKQNNVKKEKAFQKICEGGRTRKKAGNRRSSLGEKNRKKPQSGGRGETAQGGKKLARKVFPFQNKKEDDPRSAKGKRVFQASQVPFPDCGGGRLLLQGGKENQGARKPKKKKK